MSEESEVEKVISKAGELQYLGQNRAFVTLLLAIWAARKRGSPWSTIGKWILLIGGFGSYGHWNGIFL